MNAYALLLGALAVAPALLAAAQAVLLLRPASRILAVIPPTAALIAAIFLPDVGVTRIPWMLAPASVWLDVSGRAFLALTGAVWLVAVLYALTRRDIARPITWAMLLLSMSGNLLLCIAGDPIMFYFGFALMALPGYALVLAGRDGRRPARVYIAYTVLGEALVLAAVALTAAASGGASFAELPAALADSAFAPAIAMLALAGFGVKVGTPPFGGWMPLAYDTAPTSAAAALAGATSKAGVLGLLRFAAPAAYGPWAMVIVVVGLVAAYFGALVGVTQTRPRQVLAYSSISQLGLITTAVGIAAYSGLELLPVAVVALFAVHHALSKAALFLGDDIVRTNRGRSRLIALAALLLPAGAIAGVPLTGGAFAKTALKGSAGVLPATWQVPVVMLLVWSTTGTVLLIARFMWLVATSRDAQREPARAGVWPVWGLLLAGVTVVPWVMPGEATAYAQSHALDPEYLLPTLWALLAGLALSGAAILARRALTPLAGMIPAGDLLGVFEPAVAAVAKLIRRDGQEHRASGDGDMLGRLLAHASLAESRITSWAVAGTLFLALAAILSGLALLGVL